MIQDIKIKMIIDGAEGTTTINMMGAEAEQLIGKLQGLQSNPALKSFYNDLLSLGEVSENASQSIVEFVNYNQISEKQLGDVTAKLREEMSVLGIGTNEYKERQTALANLSNAQMKFQQTQQRGISTQGQMTQGANSMNQAIGQLGWVIGDANMFMVNFRMGMMSIGNNIPMVVQGLMRAKQEAAALGTTFSSQLGKSLMGAGGLMLGINALMFAMQVIPQLFDDTTEAAKEQTDALKQLRDEYKNLSSIDMEMEEASLEWRKKSLEVTNAEIEARKKIRIVRDKETGIEGEKVFWGKPGDEDLFGKNSKEIAELTGKLNELGKMSDEAAKKIKGIMSGTMALSSITEVKGAIELLNREFENVRTEAERQKIRDRIGELQELKKTMQSENDLLTDKQLKKEIDNVKLQLKKTESLREQFLLKQKLKRLLNDENVLLYASVELIDKFVKRLDKLGLAATNNISPLDQAGINFVNGMGLGGSLIDVSGDETAEEIDKKVKDKLGRLKLGETNTQLGLQAVSTQFLGQAWRRTGDIMAQSLTRGLGLLNQTNNVMQNIIASIIEMGLQMTITGLWGGLFSLVTGGSGGFMGGFMDALGIKTNFASTNPMSKPNYAQQMQLNIAVSGTLTGRGNDLVAVVNTRNKAVRQYYGKST